MPRERKRENNPRKPPASKTKPDVAEKRSENITGENREELNLQSEQQGFTLGRSPRAASVFGNSTSARNNKQARRFTEQAVTGNNQPQTNDAGFSSAEVRQDESQNPDFLKLENLTIEPNSNNSTETERTLLTNDLKSNEPIFMYDDGLLDAVEPPIIPSRFVTEFKPTGRGNETAQNRNGSANHQMFEKFQSDKPDTPQNAGAPPDQPLYAEQPQTQEVQPDSRLSANNTVLLHDHPSRFVRDRSGKIRFRKTAAVQKKPPRRKPVSSDAAKYIPSSKAQSNINSVSAGSGVEQRKTSDVRNDVGYTTSVGKKTEKPENITHEEPKPVQGTGIKRAVHSSERGSARSRTSKPGRLLFTEDKTAPDAAKPLRRKTPDKLSEPVVPDSIKQENPVTDNEIKQDSEPESAENQQSSAESTELEKPPSESDRSGAQNRADKPGKLKFTEGDSGSAVQTKPDVKPPGKKLKKAKSKAEHSAAKLDKARKKLPKKRSISFEKKLDKKSGKPQRKLRFEEEVKSQYEHIKGPLVTRPVKAGANLTVGYAHKKLYQVEHENVGTQAAHKGAVIAEGGLRAVYRHHKTAPYRKVQKLEKRTEKLNVKASYQQVLNDNPNLKSNPLSRMAQKRKIKKQYAKAAREAQRAGKKIKKTAAATEKITSKIVGAIKRHPVIIGIIGALFLLVMIISSVFTACSSMFSSTGSSIMSVTYLAEDADIDNSELNYSEWETDLLMQIENAESDYPGYNEYRYQIDGVGHDPYELMAFLTVMYQEFKYADVEVVLRQIFADQYQLTFTPSVEIRYYEDEDGELVSYNRNVLTVKLTSRSFYDIIYPLMADEEQRRQYTLLAWSKGNRQYSASPFDFDWKPYITSSYGYRVHPITGVKDYHKGIDIAVPVGTDIHSGHDGTVTFAGWDDSYGYYVVIEDGKGLVTKYAHCDSLTVSAGQKVKAGDVIAKSGNTGDSTGPHLHFELLKDGQYLNPAYFSSTNK